ncbi:hypothetical protein LCGC14_2005210 [marine sediment metagenome]|uniref:Uncharacterized protein n=1 Tax=marine sediment metagenome TaxID=412755 RepID=A0A0F9HZ08_9ZZZZ
MLIKYQLLLVLAASMAMGNLAFADNGNGHLDKRSKSGDVMSFNSDADPMYYLGFSRAHPPTAEQSALIEAKDDNEFSNIGVDPTYCLLWNSVDQRCFQDEYFKCWDS